MQAELMHNSHEVLLLHGPLPVFPDRSQSSLKMYQVYLHLCFRLPWHYPIREDMFKAW